MHQESKLPNLHPQKAAEWLKAVQQEYHVAMISSTHWMEDASWKIGTRRVHDDMLLAPFKGEVTVLFDEGEYRIRKGEIVLIPDGVPHALQTAPGTDSLEQIAIHCHITSAWRPPFFSEFTQPVLPLPHVEYWHDQFRRLTWAMSNENETLGNTYGEQVIKQLLIDLILSGATLRRRRRKLDPRIAAALHQIHQGYTDDLRVDDLAAAAELSTVQFRKLFARYTRESPKSYLIQHRLKVAARLLRSSRATVQQIAFQVGFNSEPYFHRRFKETYHCTPLTYRAGLTGV